MSSAVGAGLEIRVFYWEDRVIGRLRMRLRKVARRRQSRYFSVGNAGDIFAKNIIAQNYQAQTRNVTDGGARMLCIGSVAHKIMPNDVVCGIGTKGVPIPSSGRAPCRILGLRGPITYEAFRRAGHDLSAVRFLLDPGLLLRYMVDSGAGAEAPEHVIFIPHYRERYRMARRLPKGIRFVDIDSPPVRLAKEILNAKMVYSSSLHGIVFSHALFRPCVFVKPQTAEPLIKYEDYFAAVGLDYKRPLGCIEEARFARDSDSPYEVKFSREDFDFPSAAALLEWGIAARRPPVSRSQS